MPKIFALDGTGCHEMAQDSTEWHRMAQDGTGYSKSHMMAQDTVKVFFGPQGAFLRRKNGVVGAVFSTQYVW